MLFKAIISDPFDSISHPSEVRPQTVVTYTAERLLTVFLNINLTEEENSVTKQIIRYVNSFLLNSWICHTIIYGVE